MKAAAPGHSTFFTIRSGWPIRLVSAPWSPERLPRREHHHRSLPQLGDQHLAARVPGAAGLAVGCISCAFLAGGGGAAAAAGVRIAIEMHPGQAVYNPYTLQQLIEITGARLAPTWIPATCSGRASTRCASSARSDRSFTMCMQRTAGSTLTRWRSTA